MFTTAEKAAAMSRLQTITQYLSICLTVLEKRRERERERERESEREREREREREEIDEYHIHV